MARTKAQIFFTSITLIKSVTQTKLTKERTLKSSLLADY